MTDAKRPATLPSPQKSTIGRTLMPRAGALLSRVAPTLAGELAAHLFLRTTHPDAPERERGALEGWTPLAVPYRGRTLPAWTRGEGPAVLVVHGWDGRGAQLAGLGDAIVAAGCRVVLFDGPGHGADIARSSSIAELAEAVRAAAAVASPSRPLHAIVAHSAGGSASVRAMALGVRAHRLVLVAPGTDVERIGGEAAALLGLGDSAYRRFRAAVERRAGATWRDVDPVHAAAWLADEASLLVIHDRDDREVPLADARRLVAAWPGAELHVTRGLGHRRILRDGAVLARVATAVAPRLSAAAPALDPTRVARVAEAGR